MNEARRFRGRNESSTKRNESSTRASSRRQRTQGHKSSNEATGADRNKTVEVAFRYHNASTSHNWFSHFGVTVGDQDFEWGDGNGTDALRVSTRGRSPIRLTPTGTIYFKVDKDQAAAIEQHLRTPPKYARFSHVSDKNSRNCATHAYDALRQAFPDLPRLGRLDVLPQTVAKRILKSIPEARLEGSLDGFIKSKTRPNHVIVNFKAKEALRKTKETAERLLAALVSPAADRGGDDLPVTQPQPDTAGTQRWATYRKYGIRLGTNGEGAYRYIQSDGRLVIYTRRDFQDPVRANQGLTKIKTLSQKGVFARLLRHERKGASVHLLFEDMTTTPNGELLLLFGDLSERSLRSLRGLSLDEKRAFKKSALEQLAIHPNPNATSLRWRRYLGQDAYPVTELRLVDPSAVVVPTDVEGAGGTSAARRLFHRRKNNGSPSAMNRKLNKGLGLPPSDPHPNPS